MNINNENFLLFRVQLLSGDNYELKRIIEYYKKENLNLRKLLREKNKEIDYLKNKNNHQFTINSY